MRTSLRHQGARQGICESLQESRALRLAKFKKKFVNDSFSISNDQFKVEGSRIRIPNPGWVRMCEPLRFKGAKVLRATISRAADEWYVSISCKLADLIIVIVVDRYFPSSKLCCFCAGKHEQLKLSDREWVCPHCGKIIRSRDLNPALNFDEGRAPAPDTGNCPV